jgi:hypothetical protein
MQRRCGWLPGRAIDVDCNVAELNRSNRPIPGTGPHEIVAAKRPLAACGKWVEEMGLNSAAYGTHTLRRTKASLIYRRTTGSDLTGVLLEEVSLPGVR